MGTAVEQERDELLDDLGVPATLALTPGGTLTPAQMDALADQFLRIMGALAIEIERLTDARDHSIALIQQAYAPKIEKLATRYQAYEAQVKELARAADFGGKRKSRELVFGEYGRRASAETIKIVDQEAAVDWCEAHGYEGLVMTETKVVKKLPHAVAKPALLAYIARTGEEPPGIEHVAAKDEPYAKPAVAVVAAERGDAQEAR